MPQVEDALPSPEELQFRYRRPQGEGRSVVASVAKTDHASWDAVLVVSGETSDLHCHVHTDSFWFVIEGRARFLDADGALMAECGPNEGIVIPRGRPYSYEAVDSGGAGTLEAFLLGASDVPLASSQDDRRSLSRPIGSNARVPDDGSLSGDEPQPSPFPDPKKFSYVQPASVERKKIEIFALTDRGVFGVQVLRAGGETNLHSHPHFDGFWYVRRGAARFYTTDDVLIKELRPGEGVIIPRNYPYWFEAVIEGPDDECELLQMEAADIAISGRVKDLNNDRVDYEPRSDAFEVSI